MSEIRIHAATAVEFVEGREPELRIPVHRRPYPFSHVWQHPTEGWWMFGDNTGRTYTPPTPFYVRGGTRYNIIDCNVWIEADAKHAEWVYTLRTKAETTAP